MRKLIVFLIAAIICSVSFQAMAAKPKHHSETVTYSVNMHCQNCVNKLTDNLSFLKGVEDLRISLKDKTVTIRYNPAKVQEPKFVEIITKLGYTVSKA